MAGSLLLSVLLGVVLGAVLFALFGPRTVQAARLAKPSRLADLQGSFTAVADKVRPAVVNINTEHEIRERFYAFDWDHFWFDPGSAPFRPYTRVRKVRNLGSGFIISRDGFILTNAHVIAGADRIRVTLANEKAYAATLAGTLPDQDLALVKIAAGRELPAASLGDADRVQVGSWAIAIGSPFELTETVTVGVISAKRRVISEAGAQRVVRDLLQTDAAINFGNSGGPLVNIEGEVVGVNQAIFSPAGTGNIGIGFAIPLNAKTKAALARVMRGPRRI